MRARGACVELSSTHALRARAARGPGVFFFFGSCFFGLNVITGIQEYSCDFRIAAVFLFSFPSNAARNHKPAPARPRPRLARDLKVRASTLLQLELLFN